MTEDRPPFELDESDEETPRRTPSVPTPGRERDPAVAASLPYVGRPDRAPEEEVDDRTVAERAGRQTPRATERVGNPAGWPREALAFPLRRPGGGFLALGLAALFLLDLLGTVDALRFPGWVAKLLLLVYLLRAQFHVVGTSAAGHDEPTGWTRALAFDHADLWAYARTLIAFGGVLAPGTVLLVFDVLAPGVLLLLAGSMYASVVALGAAVGDPALKWPWHAVRWMATRPLHCLVGSLAWWALLGAELVVFRLRDEPLALVGFVSLALRALCVYGLLLSARVVGVMGRAWGP
jgi:hypothetical protein